MATEHEPQMPDLRSLRLAYATAIAATDAAKAQADNSHVRFTLALERRAAYHECRAAEVAAGRAYMAHLQEIEPACTICGCIWEDACEGGCWWASTDPYICSSHGVPVQEEGAVW